MDPRLPLVVVGGRVGSNNDRPSRVLNNDLALRVLEGHHARAPEVDFEELARALEAAERVLGEREPRVLDLPRGLGLRVSGILEFLRERLGLWHIFAREIAAPATKAMIIHRIVR